MPQVPLRSLYPGSSHVPLSLPDTVKETSEHNGNLLSPLRYMVPPSHARELHWYSSDFDDKPIIARFISSMPSLPHISSRTLHGFLLTQKQSWRSVAHLTRQDFHSPLSGARTSPRTSLPTPGCQGRSECPSIATTSRRQI